MIYIHIGFPKTGSTTIQSFAVENSDALAAANLAYPTLGRNGRAHFNFVHELREPRMFRPEAGGLKDFREMVDQAPDKNYFLSCETFHALAPEAVGRLAARLPQAPVRVIAYLRPLGSLLVSTYAQSAKMGYASEDFDSFFARRVAGGGKQLTNGVFTQLKNWADAFGWDALRVGVLARYQLKDSDLITDVLDALDLTWSDLPAELERVGGSRNISPGWKAIELMRLLHTKSGPLPQREDVETYRAVRREAWAVHRLAEEVAQTLRLNDDPGLYLTREQWETCDRAYRNLVRKLNSHLLGQQLSEPPQSIPQERPFLPDADRVPRAERAAFFEEMATKLAVELRSVSEESAVGGARRMSAERANRREERRTQRLALREGRGGTAPGAKLSAALPVSGSLTSQIDED